MGCLHLNQGNTVTPPPFLLPGVLQCACKKRGTKNSPFELVYRNTTALPTLLDGLARARHCFRLSPKSCDPLTLCCSMGIKKLEWFANNQCRRSVRLALLGGQSITWSFTQVSARDVGQLRSMGLRPV